MCLCVHECVCVRIWAHEGVRACVFLPKYINVSMEQNTASICFHFVFISHTTKKNQLLKKKKKGFSIICNFIFLFTQHSTCIYAFILMKKIRWITKQMKNGQTYPVIEPRTSRVYWGICWVTFCLPEIGQFAYSPAISGTAWWNWP